MEEEIYKANYMQKLFDILTEENLNRLEKHCKKAIHYESGNLREEHQMVLQLIYAYQNSVSKDKIRDILEKYGNSPANISKVYGMYREIKEALEE